MELISSASSGWDGEQFHVGSRARTCPGEVAAAGLNERDDELTPEEFCDTPQLRSRFEINIRRGPNPLLPAPARRKPGSASQEIPSTAAR